MREGIIYCTANAGDGSTVFKSRMVTLDIWYKPRKSPYFQNSDELVRVSGATAIFRMAIVAYPVPSPDDFVWEMYTESSWTVIESTPERQILVMDGLETYVIIYRVSDSDYGLYRVTVSNEIGTLHWNFKLLLPQTPTSPLTLWVINKTVRRETPVPREKSKISSRYNLHPVASHGPQANTKSTTDNNLKKDANNSDFLEMDFYAKQVKRPPKTTEEDAERKTEKATALSYHT
ncbi:uncharacterized protein LOC128234221 [Mya arenaria]|uniref:uncharacterized protein LOC128234221 n=1 Tax=Mya arenaria TaxID=6604 RepID=UPI0022E41418|nr:uncharacterized protein LOC128234221 [Mya arenaria]XP_052804268.1 uncharacterized protein LOC128234221 [Mya arenaria]